MSRQFKRVYDLTIQDDEGNVRVLRDLHIIFEITKTLLGFPNLARFDIYNLNETSLSLLQKKFTRITFNAGYEGSSRLLFKGQIRNVFQPGGQVDHITTVYAGDGEQAWKNSITNKTFSENISVKKVIEEIAKSFSEGGTTVGTLDGLPDTLDKLLGQTLSGSSKDLMDMYAKEYGFQWSILDGEVVTVPNEIVLVSGTAVLIRPETGMINSPTVTEIGADVTTLLNPLLAPNAAFKIESAAAQLSLGNLFFRDVRRSSAEGFYKVQEVMHTGDTRGLQWYSTTKGISLSV